MKEIWKPVNGYVGRYEVSDLGQVRRTKRLVPRVSHGKKSDFLVEEKYLSQLVTAGYLTVGIDGETSYVHRLVAKAFLPNPLSKPCVNHKNFNRKDNAVENLEWCTQKENVFHARVNGHAPKIKVLVGEESHRAKLKESDVVEIKRLHRTEKTSFNSLARQYGVCKATISHICNGRNWSHVP